MKNIMVSHIESSRNTMFRQATDAVKGRLQDMSTVVEKQLSDKLKEICDSVFRDYMAVLVGVSVTGLTNRARPTELDCLKADVNVVLRSAATLFAPVEASGHSRSDPMEKDQIQDRLVKHGGSVYAQDQERGEAPAQDQLDVPKQGQPQDQDHGRPENPGLDSGDKGTTVGVIGACDIKTEPL